MVSTTPSLETFVRPEIDDTRIRTEQDLLEQVLISCNVPEDNRDLRTRLQTETAAIPTRYSSEKIERTHDWASTQVKGTISNIAMASPDALSTTERIISVYERSIELLTSRKSIRRQATVSSR